MIESNFRARLRYHATADPATLMADLLELRRRSHAARKAHKRWWIILWICIVGGIIVTIFTAGLGLLIAAPAVLVCVLMIRRNGRLMLEDRRIALPRTVIRALACDLPPDAKLEIGIDFQNYHQPKYRTYEDPPGGYRLEQYRQAWFVLVGSLADGTRLELWLDLIVSRKIRTKTRGRFKVKESLNEQMRVVLTPRALPASAAARWPELVQKPPAPPEAHMARAVVKKNRLLLDVRTTRQVRVTNKGRVEQGAAAEDRLANRHTILMPLLAAYRALGCCRKEA